jgi:predicted ArsR family transcriptional regulator
LASTRGQILDLLWRGHQTVDELARALGLTDNAVRAQLVSLERDGLVRQAGRRRGPRKPAVTYAVTPAAEHLLPKAYAAVLTAVLDELSGQADEATVAALLTRAGQRLAADHRARFRGLDQAGQLRELGQLLRDLGGLAEIEARPGGFTIRGYSCPLLAVVAAQPATCAVVQALVGALFDGAAVQERCDRNGNARCCFAVDLPPAVRPSS